MAKDKFCDICGTNLANRDLGIIAICDCCLPKFYKNFCESLDNDIDKSIALSGMFAEFQKRQGSGPLLRMIQIIKMNLKKTKGKE